MKGDCRCAGEGGSLLYSLLPDGSPGGKRSFLGAEGTLRALQSLDFMEVIFSHRVRRTCHDLLTSELIITMQRGKKNCNAR